MRTSTQPHMIVTRLLDSLAVAPRVWRISLVRCRLCKNVWLCCKPKDTTRLTCPRCHHDNTQFPARYARI